MKKFCLLFLTQKKRKKKNKPANLICMPDP